MPNATHETLIASAFRLGIIEHLQAVWRRRRPAYITAPLYSDAASSGDAEAVASAFEAAASDLESLQP